MVRFLIGVKSICGFIILISSLFGMIVMIITKGKKKITIK